MMKPTRHNISLLLAAAAALVTTYQAAAQIDTEVKIRYEETPRLTELNKLRLTPVLSLPKTEQASLPFSSTNPSVTLPGNIATLDPAGYADTIYASPYRGYASIGFMPRFNLGASAGYNILNTDHTRLNAYFQYDGTSYRPDEMPKAIKQNTFTLGANVHQAVGKHSFIDAALDYTYSNYNTPLFDFERQSVNRFNASALWTYSTDNSVFGLGASYRRFSYGEAFYKPNYDDELDPNEDMVNGHLFYCTTFNRNYSLRMNVDITHLGTSLRIPTRTVFGQPGFDKFSSTILRAAPAFRITYSKSLLVDLGVGFEYDFGYADRFSISPDVQVTWLPSRFFKLWGKATGGLRQNSMSTLYEVSRFSPAWRAFETSNIPVDAEVGLTLGAWRGLYAQASATFARANDWLMPYIGSSEGVTYKACDLSGMKFMFKAGYAFRHWAEINASLEMAPNSKETRGYYLWRDRAKTVVNADLTVRPISDLEINLEWNFRSGRHTTADMRTDNGLEAYRISLGTLNSFNAGALYRITPQWSVFLRGENLFNHQSALIGLVPDQGRTGLAGVTYKF